MSEEAPKRGSRQFGKVESPNLMILRHDEASAPSSHCHKSTQVPTPQLIYFGPATRQIQRAQRLRHLPKIFNRHLCTTIPSFLAVSSIFIAILRLFFFCSFIKFSIGIRSRILCGPFACFPFFCYFQVGSNNKRKISLSISV